MAALPPSADEKIARASLAIAAGLLGIAPRGQFHRIATRDYPISPATVVSAPSQPGVILQPA
jgi:hypothetical protein